MKKVSKQSTKFLQFNNTNIYFIDVDGMNWIAVNPICKALNIDERRCLRNLKNDPILAPEVSKQALQVGENGIIQSRNMTCVSEQYIYGWIFSLTSDSNELLEFKKECHNLLHDHFRGTIGNRKAYLEQKAETIMQKDIWLEKLQKTNEYKEYLSAKGKINTINKIISKQDNTIVGERIKTLFDQDFSKN